MDVNLFIDVWIFLQDENQMVMWLMDRSSHKLKIKLTVNRSSFKKQINLPEHKNMKFLCGKLNETYLNP
jgi:hypothetical protein